MVFVLTGVDRYYDNVEMMLGFRINSYMKVCWRFLTPMFTLVRPAFFLFFFWKKKTVLAILRCLLHFSKAHEPPFAKLRGHAVLRQSLSSSKSPCCCQEPLLSVFHSYQVVTFGQAPMLSCAQTWPQTILVSGTDALLSLRNNFFIVFTLFFLHFRVCSPCVSTATVSWGTTGCTSTPSGPLRSVGPWPVAQSSWFLPPCSWKSAQLPALCTK